MENYGNHQKQLKSLKNYDNHQSIANHKIIIEIIEKFQNYPKSFNS